MGDDGVEMQSTKPDRRLVLRVLVVVVVVLVAAALRTVAAIRLPTDYDEPVYFNSAEAYASVMRAGNLVAIPDADPNVEHPPLFKLLYGVLLAQSPPAPEAPVEPAMVTAPGTLARLREMRLLSAAFGVLNVLVVGAVSPLAGLFLAAHTYHIKYTAQAFLESLPLLTSTISVLAYMKSGRRANGWLALSAAALGLTAASKYTFALVGVAVVLDWLREALFGERREGASVTRQIGLLMAWGVASVLVFLAANPALWPAPLARLGASLSMLVGRAESAHAQSFGYGVPELLWWLFTPITVPGAIFTPFDTIPMVLSLVGLPRTWKTRPVIATWWAVGLALLLLWTVRLPHYTLVMTVPVTLCAAAGVEQIIAWVQGRQVEGTARPVGVE